MQVYRGAKEEATEEEKQQLKTENLEETEEAMEELRRMNDGGLTDSITIGEEGRCPVLQIL